MKKLALVLSVLLSATPVMAVDLTITVPANQTQDVLDAYGYVACTEEVVTFCSNLSPKRYMQGIIVKDIKKRVKGVQTREAMNVARESVGDIVITETD